jgi:hypothetical protein
MAKTRTHVGQLWAFRGRVEDGDLVVLPLKTQSAIAIGKATGPYEYRTDLGDSIRHARPVEWLVTDLPRTTFDQDLLYSLGAFMTVCQISRHNAAERIKAVLAGQSAIAKAMGNEMGLPSTTFSGVQSKKPQCTEPNHDILTRYSDHNPRLSLSPRDGISKTVRSPPLETRYRKIRYPGVMTPRPRPTASACRVLRPFSATTCVEPSFSAWFLVLTKRHRPPVAVALRIALFRPKSQCLSFAGGVGS